MGFICFFLAIVGSAVNLASGFKLAQSPSSLDQLHLVTALATLVFACVGAILLIRKAEATWDLLVKEARLTKDQLDRLLIRKQKGFFLSGIIFAISILSLITGALSHGGEWPYIHSLLGIGLLLSLLNILWHWRVYFSQVASFSK